MMKSQLHNIFTTATDTIDKFVSPLEQFKNLPLYTKYYDVITPEMYLTWFWNHDYKSMCLLETDYFFEQADYIYFMDKVRIICFAIFIFVVMGGLIFLYTKENINNFVNKNIFLGWLLAKVVLFYTTIGQTSFKYLTANVPTDVPDMPVIEAFVIAINHGGFLVTDSATYFVSAILLLYLSTAFQNFNNSKGPFIVSKNPNTYIQLAIYKMTIELISSSMDKKYNTQQYHVFIYVLFTYLAISNLQGLIPYSVTITSHLVATLFLGQAVIIYVTVTILSEQGFKYFLTLFMPSGVPVLLSYLLVPLEFISFFFKTVSLSVRLFANMMAGHTLLKVILGFAWTLLALSESYFLINLFPVVILILLTLLEVGVALIQAYIFSILTCLSLRDAYCGH